MTGIGLALNEDKTRLRDARCDAFDFLGYTFSPMYSPRTGGRYNGGAAIEEGRRVPAERHSSSAAARQPGALGGRRPYPEPHRAGLVRLLLLRHGHEGRHDVTLHLYHTVRRFLRRRHKLAGSGSRRFPMPVVFGELGVVSPLALSRPPLRPA
jgi:RNA-directed DNA polymerase